MPRRLAKSFKNSKPWLITCTHFDLGDLFTCLTITHSAYNIELLFTATKETGQNLRGSVLGLHALALKNFYPFQLRLFVSTAWRLTLTRKNRNGVKTVSGWIYFSTALRYQGDAFCFVCWFPLTGERVGHRFAVKTTHCNCKQRFMVLMEI